MRASRRAPCLDPSPPALPRAWHRRRVRAGHRVNGMGRFPRGARPALFSGVLFSQSPAAAFHQTFARRRYTRLRHRGRGQERKIQTARITWRSRNVPHLPPGPASALPPPPFFASAPSSRRVQRRPGQLDAPPTPARRTPNHAPAIHSARARPHRFIVRATHIHRFILYVRPILHVCVICRLSAFMSASLGAALRPGARHRRQGRRPPWE